MTPEMAAPAAGAGAIVFWAAAALAVLGALLTVLFRSPIRSAMALLLNILSLAVLFVLLDAHLLAVVQVLVYAGAVVVLFVFVIMVLGPRAEPAGPGGRAIAARVFSLIFLALIGYRLVGVLFSTRLGAEVPEGFGTIASVADEIFGPYLVPFELVSILLLVALVGAMAIARGKQAKEGERQK